MNEKNAVRESLAWVGAFAAAAFLLSIVGNLRRYDVDPLSFSAFQHSASGSRRGGAVPVNTVDALRFER